MATTFGLQRINVYFQNLVQQKVPRRDGLSTLSRDCPCFADPKPGWLGSEGCLVVLQVELYDEEGMGWEGESHLISCQVSPILNNQFKR